MVVASVLVPKVTEQLASIAAALQEKAAQVLRAIQVQVGAVKPAAAPGRIETASGMNQVKGIGLATFQAARQMFQTQRDMQLQNIRDQQRPA